MKRYNEIIRSDLFTNGLVVVFMWNNNTTWSVEAVSKNIEKVFGYKDTLFLENKLAYINLIHPDDINRVTKEVEKATLQKLDSFNHEPYRVLDANGKYLWVKDSTTIFYDEARNITHFVGTIISINDEIRKNQEQKEELQTIFDTTKDGIAIIDLDTNFIKVNKAYCNITGLSEEELLNTSCFSLTYPEDMVVTTKKLKKLFEDGFIDSYEKRCMIHGKVITVNLSIAILPDGKHMLVSMKDVSRFKIFEEQAKLASMGEMMGNIAHQWRQPLSVISAIASGIGIKHDFGLLDEKALINSIESIILQVNYLSETIDDFRNFIKDVDEFQKLSLGTMLQKTFAIIKPTLAVNQILLIDEINDDMIIQGSENQLIQAFINIINNAKDAIIKNIKNEEDRLILVTTKKFENKLEISIQDSGGGILSDAIEHLFEPYFTTKHQSVGTGMGLSMVYKIFTEKHNATIKVENVWFEYNQKDYKGACFSIVFDS